jgi:PEGA domain-containing protein
VAILKIPRFWPALLLGRTSPVAADAVAAHSVPPAGLDAFGSEASPIETLSNPPVPVREHGSGGWVPTAAKWLAVILLSAGAAVAGVVGYQHRFARTAATGSVTVETSPSGLDVVLAGKTLGKTPLNTSLAPGAYDLQVGSAPNVRTIKINVVAGTAIVQRMEFAAPAQAGKGTSGGLRVQTEPAHLPVLVDGEPHGVSPVALDNLEPGDHEIAVRTSGGYVKRAVSIQPHETLSLIVSSAAPAADPSAVAAGWMSVSSPVSLQLRENGKLIGTSESDRLMLPAGDHDIEFANEGLGFAVRRTVRVAAGKTAATKIDLPNGVLSINAQPWAEVFVDGERIGETPIGNLSRRIGNHEVLFRHPDLGERRENVVVTVGKPARIGVDLRKK